MPPTGIGTNCRINIAYNKQAGLCSSETSRYDDEERLLCRGWGELCLADSDYDFEFNEDSEVGTVFRPS
jgi:integrin alpha FG-GAP repeat containing protein 1